MPHINNAGTQVPANQRVGLTNNPGISVRTWVKNTTAPLPVQSAYFDSDSVTGPWLTNKTNAPSGVVQYQIKVFNTGTVTLSNIVVAVRNLSNIQVQRYTIAQISRGGSATLYYKPAFAQGQQVSACDGAAAFRSCCIALHLSTLHRPNAVLTSVCVAQGINAVASVVYNGRTLTASNRGHYLGMRPRIALSKLVLSGTQWMVRVCFWLDQCSCPRQVGHHSVARHLAAQPVESLSPCHATPPARFTCTTRLHLRLHCRPLTAAPRRSM